MFTALTIAGSDSCGGAGIQADIKTMTAHGVYAMSVITALTAQNTTGVTDIMEVTPDFLIKQMDAVFEDIYPDAVKIGMLSSKEIMEAVASSLKKYKVKNIVLDPVMVATSGAALSKIGTAEYMKNELFPLARIITPNIPETEVLTGKKVDSLDAMKMAGKELYDYIASLKDEAMPETAVVIKGGHMIEDATDILFAEGKCIVIKGERINNPNTHGTGCTLSSAIASNLAMGKNIEDSVRNAKDYISGALKANLNLGKGSGPLNHVWNFSR